MAVHVYQFAGFRLDAAARTLSREGEPVALPPKVFDCIVYLIENRDRAIGRDELIASVWGKIDVADGVLGQTILLARRALGDTGKTPQIIRTVVRFGYHWLATVDVHDVTVANPAAALSAHSADRPPPQAADPVQSVPAGVMPDQPIVRWRPGHARVALAALACISIALLVWMLAQVRHDAISLHQTSAQPDTALVLPVTVTGDTQAAWIRLGVMDLVSTRLRSAGQSIVPSDNVVALAHAYTEAATDAGQLQALADAAAVRLVIDARAEWIEGQWRVSLRTLLGRVPAISVSAESADVLTAAHEATDRLGIALGVSASRPGDPSGMLSTDPLVQKVEAALLEDRVEVARTLLDSATPEQRDEPAVRFQLGRVDFQSGRLDTAETTFRSLTSGGPASDDPAMQGQALNALGGIALQRQQPNVAMPLFDDAISVLGRSGAIGALGKAYGNRAAAHAMRGDYAAELSDLAQARIALTTSGDMLGLAVIDSNAGTSAMNRDRFAEAAPIFADAIKRFASFHAYAAELNALGNQAQDELALLDPASALQTAKRLAELISLVPDPGRRHAANLIRAEVLYANGHVTEGDALLVQLRTDTASDAPALAGVQALAARSALAAGNAALAEREAQASLAIPPMSRDSREIARTWLTLIRAQLADRDIVAADASLAQAHAWAKQDDSAAARLFVALALAERAALADESGVRDAFEDVLAQAERDRVPADLVTVSKAYAIWLMQRQDFLRASAVAEGIAGWATRDYCAALLRLHVFHALHDPAAWQAALVQAQALAGERAIPAHLMRKP